MQTLGGLKQYILGYHQSRARRAAVKSAAEARQIGEREDADRMAYDRYRRAQADELFETLPGEERDAIERLSRTGNRPFVAGDGSLASTIYVLTRARITAERHPNKIRNFEIWREANRAA